jgi:hypothetical protein
MDGQRNYPVGYRKPPKHSRFKRGESGNPKGRPKGTRNLKSDVEEELQRRITVREAGREQPVSKQRGVIMALFNKALQGDPRAINMLLDLIMRFTDEAAADTAEEALSATDQEILDTYETRIIRGHTAETEQDDT